MRAWLSGKASPSQGEDRGFESRRPLQGKNMLNFDQQASKIRGWLTKSEALFLYNIAMSTPKEGLIIEIGSWEGRSTVCLGQGCKDGNGASVYAIDPHTGSSEHRKMWGKVDTYQTFLNNIREASVDKYVRPIKDTSENAAKDFNKEIDFIFVDGAHEYKYVKLDYETWFPKLKTGGLIAFHDCWHCLGVQAFTAKLLITSPNIKNPKLLDTLTIVEKVDKNSLYNRAHNILFVIYRLLFGFVGTIKMNYFGGKVI